MYLTEKMRLSDELSSGRQYSAVGHEFNMNEATGRGRCGCTALSETAEFIPVLFILLTIYF